MSVLRKSLIVAAGAWWITATPAHLQEAEPEGADDNGFIINLLEDKLSTEDRKIRLSGVEGVLSSSATVSRITISDQEGVWLRIDNAEINWNRSALLRGSVEIETLSAERIEIPRGPIAQDNLPDPEPRSFEIPELPVSITLENLDVDEVVLGEPLIGFEATLSVEGRLSLSDGALDTALSIDRLDGPRGEFELAATYSNASEVLDLALSLSEPPNGVVANLLQIENRPSVDLTIDAEGALSDLSAQIDFRADGRDLLDGSVRVSDAEDGRQIGVNLVGTIQPLVAPSIRPFFANESRIVADARLPEAGGFALENLRVESGGLDLTAQLATTPDGFLSDLRVNGTVAAADGSRMVLPVAGGETDVSGIDLVLNYGSGDMWDGKLDISQLRSGGISVDRAIFDMGGLAQNLQDPENRRISVNIEGTATGIDAEQRNLAEALGSEYDLNVEAVWQTGAPIEIAQLLLSGNGVAISTTGVFAESVYEGDAIVDVADISPLSALLSRNLSGAIRFEAGGTINPLTGAFDMLLNGETTDLVLDIDALDPLLAGMTTAEGGLSRTEAGLRADAFDLSNDQAAITADGIYSTEYTDFDLKVALVDIGLITQQASGGINLDLGLTGGIERMDVAAEVSMPEGQLGGRAVRDGTLSYRGTGPDLTDQEGTISGAGQIGASPLTLTGKLDADQNVQFLREFLFTLDQTRASGNIGRGFDGLIAGSVDVASPDIAPVAALALTEARGAVDLKLILSREVGTQRAAIDGTATGLEFAGNSVGSVDIDMTVSDILGIPLADGDLRATGARIAGYAVERLDIETRRANGRMDVNALAELENGTRLDLRGGLEQLQPGFGIDLQGLELASGDARAVLQEPARLEVVGSDLTLSRLLLDVGGGRIAAQGSVADALDISIDLDSVPLDVANAIRPDLGLSGTISGEARVTGPRTQPQVSAVIGARDVSAAQIRALGLPPINADATADTRGEVLEIRGDVSAGDGVSADINGQIPFDPEAESLQLEILLDRFELALVDRLAGNQGLTGRASGSASVTGSLSDPAASFRLSGDGLSARILRDNGVPNLALDASGSFAGNVVDLTSLELTANGGLQLAANGTIPLSGGGLDVRVDGSAPLSLANAALSGARAQLAGTVIVNGTATGSVSDPNLSGTVQVPDGTFVSGRRNFRVDRLTLDAVLDGDRVTIRQASGQVATGGTVSLSGNLGLGPTLPADLELVVDEVTYTDGEVVTTTVSGRLALNGPILGQGEATGVIEVGQTEIVIPRRFGINEGVLLDLEHRNAPRDVVLTLDRAEMDGQGESGPSAVAQLGLDIRVNAPNRIFIRGRGLDAEMGGSLQLRGTVGDPVPVGSIELIRGRLGLLGQRIQFDEGSITLVGNFDPVIRLVAETEANNDTTVIVSIEGSASDPQIRFSSVPPLPQDEVLALLIFNRSVSELSAFQVAQLAAAAATLAGSGGNGVVDNLRSGIGLANLDITSDEEGNVGVRAGAYLDENIYLDVETGTGGSSKATINLDITETVRARGSVDSEGETEIGIFYERDY